MEQKSILAFHRANVVFPFHIARAAVPAPVSSGCVQQKASWPMSSGLFGKLPSHAPTWKKPQNRNPHGNEPEEWHKVPRCLHARFDQKTHENERCHQA